MRWMSQISTKAVKEDLERFIEKHGGGTIADKVAVTQSLRQCNY